MEVHGGGAGPEGVGPAPGVGALLACSCGILALLRAHADTCQTNFHTEFKEKVFSGSSTNKLELAFVYAGSKQDSKNFFFL